MRRAQLLLVLLALLSGPLVLLAAEKEAPKENPVAWGYVRGEAYVTLRPGGRAAAPAPEREAEESEGLEAAKALGRRAGPVRVGRGTLLPILKWEDKKGARWARVRAVNLDYLEPINGWIESSQIEEVGLAKFPTDAALLRLLGGDFLDDYAFRHTQVVRFLVQQGSAGPALICFLTAPVMANARLVAFLPVSGQMVPGPSVEFPAAEIQAGITMAEVRDLLGDGNECLITREPFRVAFGTRGANEVVRRVEGSEFQVLWEAPLEFRSLDMYPARVKVLQPPEKNIGQPGTVTKGEVTFRQHGSIYEPVWKGKVEFYVPGREEPVQSVPVEKVCPWDGAKFQPLP